MWTGREAHGVVMCDEKEEGPSDRAVRALEGSVAGATSARGLSSQLGVLSTSS